MTEEINEYFKQRIYSLMNNEKDKEIEYILFNRYCSIRDTLLKENIPFEDSCNISYSYLLALLFRATHDPPKE